MQRRSHSHLGRNSLRPSALSVACPGKVPPHRCYAARRMSQSNQNPASPNCKFFLPLACLLAACGASPSVPPQSDFDSARAWQHLETIVGFGVRSAETDGLKSTREYLMTELKSYGLTPVLEKFEDDTPIGVVSFGNVYADIGPADRPLVILCTHIDTKIFKWEFVGANDSGSGTAVLLELARCIAKLTEDSKLSYRILFLDGEESIREQWVDPDNRYGSRYHAQRLVDTGELSRVKACVLLDLVGDKDLKLTAESYSDSRLRSIFFKTASEIGLGAHVDGPAREILDDHLSFMAVDIPSVDLIDYDYGPNNEYWHSPKDTLENVSEASLDVIGRIVLAALPKLQKSITGR
ncbi:MAG: glutaminyl-peptide cyclotransferase [Planctomycetota bacterium]|jgi:glutaminyl-peptide cyclotransferase